MTIDVHILVVPGDSTGFSLVVFCHALNVSFCTMRILRFVDPRSRGRVAACTSTCWKWLMIFREVSDAHGQALSSASLSHVEAYHKLRYHILSMILIGAFSLLYCTTCSHWVRKIKTRIRYQAGQRIAHSRWVVKIVNHTQVEGRRRRDLLHVFHNVSSEGFSDKHGMKTRLRCHVALSCP